MADEPRKPEPSKPAPRDPEAKAPAAAPAPATIDPATIAMIAQVVAQMQSTQGLAAARVAGQDEAPAPGGKYVVDGVEVNAWGVPFEEGRDPSQDDPEKSRFRK